MTVYLYRNVQNNPGELEDAEPYLPKVDNIVLEFAYKERRREMEALLNRISNPDDRASAKDAGYRDEYHRALARFFENSGKRIVLEQSPFSVKQEEVNETLHRRVNDAMYALDFERYRACTLEFVRRWIVPNLRARDDALFGLIKGLKGSTLAFVGLYHVYLGHLLRKEKSVGCEDRMSELTPYEARLIPLCRGDDTPDEIVFIAFTLHYFAETMYYLGGPENRQREVQLARRFNFPEKPKIACGYIQKFFADARQAKAENPTWFTENGRALEDYLCEWVDSALAGKIRLKKR